MNDKHEFGLDHSYKTLSKARNGVTCKYCFEVGFVWADTEEGWRLFNREIEQLHDCPSRPKASCRECGQPIRFEQRGKRGSWLPINVEDDRVHFETCAPQQRKP